MNGDMPHDGGHGGGGHAVVEELQKTGRYDALPSAQKSGRMTTLDRNTSESVSLPSGFAGVCYLTSKEKRLSSSVTSPTRFTSRPCRPSCLFTWAP